VEVDGVQLDRAQLASFARFVVIGGFCLWFFLGCYLIVIRGDSSPWVWINTIKKAS